MNKHIGSSLDDFLSDEGLLEEVTAAALKRVIAWQLAEVMKAQKVSKKALAERMHTSRTAVDRALDQKRRRHDVGHSCKRGQGIGSTGRSAPCA